MTVRRNETLSPRDRSVRIAAGIVPFSLGLIDGLLLLIRP